MFINTVSHFPLRDAEVAQPGKARAWNWPGPPCTSKPVGGYPRVSSNLTLGAIQSSRRGFDLKPQTFHRF